MRDCRKSSHSSALCHDRTREPPTVEVTCGAWAGACLEVHACYDVHHMIFQKGQTMAHDGVGSTEVMDDLMIMILMMSLTVPGTKLCSSRGIVWLTPLVLQK